ncbi:MAG: bifunctional 4-hydroxy-2-oxoglutarate aldolase/2-dehydro-3-deoxy-phosphogluconate aldolase [Roseovarius sp.]|nr:bifunctional 4-hydroxy-2-oxoglutarate aldolase/2-dehydro-3-deoxy-phosphogluconate aldolase [Roseovarius sp.]
MAILPRDASLMMRDFCALAPIMPVLVVDDASSARPLAEVLIGAGLPALEVTLRTPAALDATKEMATVPGGQVGVGTLITPDDVRAAKRAGAAFGVSPGATEEVLAACEEEGLPLLPGAATASEAMSLLARGYDMLKFFPAEPSGGTRALKAFGGPLPQISFCPTGGISTGNAGEYLGLDNVLCVGGSWIAPRDLVARGGWDEIEKRAKAAAGLG